VRRNSGHHGDTNPSRGGSTGVFGTSFGEAPKAAREALRGACAPQTNITRSSRGCHQDRLSTYRNIGALEKLFDLVWHEVHLEMNMKNATETINTKELRAGLGRIIERARRGASFLVLHRSRPAFQIVPPAARHGPLPPLQDETLYRAKSLGRSKDGLRAADHDRVLYRR
jgi:antitoxin (DNA-binding transcriptional repressor) of toxin-antitoxin stability system